MLFRPYRGFSYDRATLAFFIHSFIVIVTVSIFKLLAVGVPEEEKDAWREEMAVEKQRRGFIVVFTTGVGGERGMFDDLFDWR